MQTCGLEVEFVVVLTPCRLAQERVWLLRSPEYKPLLLHNPWMSVHGPRAELHGALVPLPLLSHVSGLFIKLVLFKERGNVSCVIIVAQRQADSGSGYEGAG